MLEVLVDGLEGVLKCVRRCGVCQPRWIVLGGFLGCCTLCVIKSSMCRYYKVDY